MSIKRKNILSQGFPENTLDEKESNHKKWWFIFQTIKFVEYFQFTRQVMILVWNKMLKLAKKSTFSIPINVISIINVIVLLIIIMTILNFAIIDARKSMRRGRSRKINSPRLITSNNSKRKENYNNTDVSF